MDLKAPKRPMDNQENYRNTLRYAEALAGSPAQLAHALDIDSELLSSWFRGTAPIPDDIFLRLVELVLNASKQDVERSRGYQHSWNQPDDS